MNWGFLLGRTQPSSDDQPEKKHFKIKKLEIKPARLLRPPPLNPRGRAGSDASSVSSCSSFQADIAAGLSSPTFNLNENTETGDGRGGLDEAAKAQILEIMQECYLSFDEARKIYTDRLFKLNSIGPDGLPDDPKLVCFSSPASKG